MRTLLALCLILLAPPALAERIAAVLIGVGAYPALPGADLRGPPTDVRLMAGALIARGADPADILALTTDTAGLPPGIATGLPTRAAIMAALGDLARRAGPGVTAVIHFSGHGAQAPDDDGDEMGGMDEILLPTDTAPGGAGAIRDDEMRRAVQAILDTGARVVGVIDACHSATGFRDIRGAGVARTLPPGLLALEPVRDRGTGAPPPPPAGDYVFLYAAQSDQRAFEFPTEGDAEVWAGAFTTALTAVLHEAPAATWGQALAEAQARLRAGAAVQTPDGEGPLLAAPIPGAGAASPRLPAERGRLMAGALRGLTEGTTVALYDSPLGGAPVATARLARVTADAADLTPAPPPGRLWAEVTAPAPPPPLRLAPPDPASPWARALARAAAAGVVRLDPLTPDLVPVDLPGGGLAFAGRDGVLDPAGPGSSPRIAQGDDLAVFLDRAGRTLRLARVLGAAGRATFAAPPLAVAAERRAGARDGAGCGAGGAAEPFAGQAAHCDEIWLTVTNRARTAQDVTILYRDRDFGLAALWPVGGVSNRLAPGQRAVAGLRVELPEGAAAEEILILAVAADLTAPRTDLTALADGGAARATGLAGGLLAMLDPDRTRAFTPPALSPLSVMRLPVAVRPEL
jgi:hypothetical protein